MVVRVERVAFAYPGGIRALAGVDLDLAAGELAVVVGPNGSGKSTLLKVVAGLIRPDSGRLRVHDRDLAELTSRQRAREIALVPQGLLVVPEVRVRDFVLGGRYAHLDFWRTVREADRRAVDEALRCADAAAWGERMIGELSGGQRQRVLIARALAQDARILLFDEPTTSLDPEHQLLVMALVRELADAGSAALVATHDFNLASQFADRLILLDEGRTAAEGTPAEVLCEAVLAPVYGSNLQFGSFPGGAPMVVPRRDGHG